MRCALHLGGSELEGSDELVLHDAEHYAFSDGQQPRKRDRNPNHHRVILALSTAFWDTHLSGNQAARVWLLGDSPRKIMESNDQWQLNAAGSKADKRR
jgi:hypothetical protein